MRRFQHFNIRGINKHTSEFKYVFFIVLSSFILSSCDSNSTSTEPQLSLIGDRQMSIEAGSTFIDPGATVINNPGEEIEIVISGNVNTAILGEYTITYHVDNSLSNLDSISRTVTVIDTTPPILTFIKSPDETSLTLGQGRYYKEYGALASDNLDGEIIVDDPIGVVDVDTLGTYTLIYNASDSSGNETTIERDIHIVEPRPMILTYRVEANERIVFALEGSNIEIDFGDGDGYESFVIFAGSHTYSEANDYTVRIRGNIYEANFCTKVRGSFFIEDSLFQINDWGDVVWSTLDSVFLLCDDFDENEYITLGEPDLLTANVKNETANFSMQYAFAESNFNQPINHWDVSMVSNMSNLFENSDVSIFNRPLDAWDVSNVTTTKAMFYGVNGSRFNQDISPWQISRLSSANNMFGGAELSTIHYDSLLNSWSTQNIIRSGVYFSAGNSQYSSASESARNTLINNFGWVISDDGLNDDVIQP